MSEMPSYSDSGSSNKTLKIVLIIVGVFLLLCIGAFAACFFGMKKLMNVGGDMIGCVMSPEMSVVALEAYAEDHDGKLPPADKWQDEIMPYYQRLYDKRSAELAEMENNPITKGMFVLIKPGEPLGCKTGETETGFAFNSDLSEAVWADIEDPSSTPLIFEVSTKRYNANEPYAEKPESESPQIMGDRRGWLIFHVDGSMYPNEFGNMDTQTGPLTVEDAKGGGSTTPEDGEAGS